MLGTDPFDSTASNLTAIERAAFGTSNAARKRIDIECCGFGELFFSLFEKDLYFSKDFLLNDGGVSFGGVVHIFLATVFGLLERNCGIPGGFLIVAISDVSLIGEHIGDFGGLPFLLAVLSGDATVGQFLCDFRGGHTAEVGVEDPPHDVCFGRILHELLVFKSESVRCVAVT